MKVFVVLSAVMVCALSQVIYPYGYSHLNVAPFGGYYNAIPYSPLAYRTVAPYVVPTSSQYHAQDELGQFTFGTAGDNQARVESKSYDGTVTGAYSYVDPTGKLVNVNYLADHNGFRVLGANNLPVAPAIPDVKGPEPVKDTPEVVAARAEFMKKFDEAKAMSEKAPEMMSRKKRQAVFYSSPLVSSFVHPVVHPVVAPALAKTTLKYKTFEPVDAKTPADTKKIELKDKETEVITHAVAPLTYSALPAYTTYSYGYPAYRSPFFYSY